MAVGTDIQVFISASRALLQSVTERALTEEERRQLRCCLEEVAAILSTHLEDDEPGRHAA